MQFVNLSTKSSLNCYSNCPFHFMHVTCCLEDRILSRVLFFLSFYVWFYSFSFFIALPDSPGANFHLILCFRYCKCEMPYNPDDLMVQCESCSDW